MTQNCVVIPERHSHATSSEPKTSRAQEFELTRFTATDRAAVDRFVVCHPQGHATHRPAWREAVIEAYGGIDISIVARIGDQIVGFLPLWISEKCVKGVGVSSPFGNFAGPLTVGLGQVEDAATMQNSIASGLLATAKQVVADEKLTRVEIRDTDESLFANDLAMDEIRSIYTLNVTNGSGTVWRGATGTARNRKRRAVKNGLAVRRDRDLLGQFYEMYVRAMKNHGTPGHPLRFFVSLADHFENDFDILGVEDTSHDVLAGLITIQSGTTLSYPWQCSVPRRLGDCPNDLLIWCLVERAEALGCSRIDMGRSIRNSSQSRFKEKWGATEHRLCNWTYPHPVQCAADRHAWASKLWRKLPLSLARRIGPVLRKQIP